MARDKGKAVAAVAVAGGLGLLGYFALTGKAEAAPKKAPAKTPAKTPSNKPKATLTEKERAVALAATYSRAFGVPTSLVLALMAVGGWRPVALVKNTRGGAWGYTFITLATAQDLTKRFPAIAAKYWPKFAANQTGQALLDPAENIAIGAYQMSLQWKRFGEWYTAALSYYTGAGAMDKLIAQGGGKKPPPNLTGKVATQKAAYTRVRTADPYVARALAQGN